MVNAVSLKSIYVSSSEEENEAGRRKKLHQKIIDGVTVLVDGRKSRRVLTDLLKRLEQIPAGQDVLKVLRERKIPLQVQGGLGNVFGYFSPGSMEIVLNSEMKKEKLCSTLVHETHHLMQHLRDPSAQLENLDLKSQIMLDRAKEADSQTWALRACREWLSLGDDEPYKQFKMFYPEIAIAFERALRDNGGVEDNRVWTETFKSWYDQKGVRTAYEQNYMTDCAVQDLYTQNSLNAQEKERMRGPDGGRIYYFETDKKLQSLSCEAVLKITGGEYFVEDASVLETPELLGVLSYTRSEMAYLFDRNGISDRTVSVLPETQYSDDHYARSLAGDDLKHTKESYTASKMKFASDMRLTNKKLDELLALSTDVDAQKAALDTLHFSADNLRDFRRLNLMRLECERAEALMDYVEMPSVPRKEKNEAYAALLKKENVLLAMSFVEEYRDSNPGLARAFRTTSNLPSYVRKALADADKLYQPMGVTLQRTTDTDRKRMIVLNKAMLRRTDQIDLLENAKQKTAVFSAAASYKKAR